LTADLALARRLERMDALGEKWFSQTHAELHPDAGAAYEEIAGGVMAYAGIDHPMTQAFGLGLNGEVTTEEINRLEDFFRQRGASANIEVCPLADESLIRILNERGYRIAEFSNVLVKEIDLLAWPTPVNETTRVRETIPEEYYVWVEAIARGFSDNRDILPLMREAGLVFFNQEYVRTFLVDVEGIVAGGGAMSIYDDVANIFGTSTIQSYRGRGGQTALIGACVDAASEASCSLAMATTICGTISQRNFERHGFRVAYTRCKLFRDFADLRH
jgi:GNAT superfamily N-acetyltransferase